MAEFQGEQSRSFRAEALRRLLLNGEAYDRLILMAEEAARRGDRGSAHGYASAAANYQWNNHGGRFSSRALEDLLRASSPRYSFSSRLKTKTVLHVASKIAMIGGHVQLMRRWIALDSESEHRVVVTSERTRYRSCHRFDGVRVRYLDGSALSRAVALQEEANHCGLIVLHVHPDDVVPILAFGGSRPTAPIIFVNHADHVFWLGASVATVIACLRPSSIAIAKARRGIEPGRALPFPLPLVSPPLASGLASRDRFGIPGNAKVALTIGSAYKYQGTPGVSFLDLVLPVVTEHEDLYVLAIGPTSTDEWARARQETRGRILAIGPQSDLSDAYSAADLYLDSYPTSSLTAVLEAALAGLPILSLNWWQDEYGIFSVDDIALDPDTYITTTVQDFHSKLRLLLANSSLRHETGMSLQAEVLRSHCGTGWVRTLQDLAFAAREMAEGDSTVSPPSHHELDVMHEEVDYRSAMLASRKRVGESLASHLLEFQGLDRCRTFLRVAADFGLRGAGITLR